MLEIDPEELKRKLDAGEPVHLLDVREPAELDICRMEGAEHIPMMPLFLGLQRPAAGPDDAIAVICHSGMRSLEAARYLQRQGYTRAVSLRGGIDAWAAAYDPGMTRY